MSVVFAVIAGLLFAIPFAALLASGVAGGPAPAQPVPLHELHAVAGVGFGLSLLELRRRYAGWFGTRSRIAVALAVASALAFVVGNVGEIVSPDAPFLGLYVVALVALSVCLIAIAATTRTLPRPIPLLLAVIGVWLPLALVLLALPRPVGPMVWLVGLLAYGLLWAGLGFVQLSRDP